MTYRTLWQRLLTTYPEGEAKAIARLVYEVRYGLSFGDILLGRDAEADDGDLQQIALRLERHEPVQYVLGETMFCGHTFHTDRRALIPRPETEELCRWMLAAPFDSLLDIGTGSGCIAVTMALAQSEAQVVAWDISPDALALAAENADALRAKVTFLLRDALTPSHEDTERYDIIVSNPPYICQKEAEAMASNVLDYEPHQALFVPDSDPLRFYRAIARHGQTKLRPQGHLFFEINPLYAESLCAMLRDTGYRDVTTRCDAFGKIRFIRCRL